MCSFANASAERHELGVFIPCFRDVNCMTFSLFGERDDDDDDERISSSSGSSSGSGSSVVGDVGKVSTNPRDFRNVSVLAGHFTWDVWQELRVARAAQYHHDRQENENETGNGGRNGDISQSECSSVAPDGACSQASAAAKGVNEFDSTAEGNRYRDRGGDGYHHASYASRNIGVANPALPTQQKKNGSCFVMGRHPLQRVLAYYYQRCYSNKGCVGYGRYFNELSVREVIEIERTFREIGEILTLDDSTTQVTKHTV
jgi:hypothetical protein